MAIGGLFLRIGGMGLRALEFGAAAVALGIYSYFLAVLSDNQLPIAAWKKAVEGIAGAAVLYTILAFLLTLCLGGNRVFSFLLIFLDICFAGAFIAVAILTRSGASSCTGYVNTPLGSGESDAGAAGYGANGFGFGNNQNVTYSPKLRTACRYNTAVFAVSIIAIFLFLLSAAYQLLLVRQHKKDKAAGISTKTTHTKKSRGHSGPFWKRNKKVHHNTRDAEAATAMPMTHEYVTRPSHETGTTVGNNAFVTEPKYGQPGYGQQTHGQPGYGQQAHVQPTYGQQQHY